MTASPAWFVGPVDLDYGAAWDLQKRLQQARIDGLVPDVVLLVQHPPVVTLGRRAEAANVLAPRATLEAAGIGLYEVERGGDVTLHGPGQITGYPILDLDRHGRDLHLYLRNLEEAMIRVLARHELSGTRVDGMTGVWVDGAKVAAIGVKVRRWVTMHGFAFNVDLDLDLYRWIVPCGISDKPVTSLERLLAPAPCPSLPAVAAALLEELTAVFGFRGEVRSLEQVREAAAGIELSP